MLVSIPRTIPGAQPYVVGIESESDLPPELALRLAIQHHARERIPLRCANLMGANLIGANLDGLHLIECTANSVDFSGASLRGVHLQHVQMFLATLDAADIKDSLFEVVNLGHASCEGMTFASSTLSGCNLRGAKLDGSTFSNSHLSSCRTAGATWSGATFDCCDTRTLEDFENVFAATGMAREDAEAQKFYANRLHHAGADEARRDAEAFRARLVAA